MVSQAPVQFFSPDEYLKSELVERERREFVAGRVFAMGGASDKHNTIAHNLFVALRNLLLDPHQVFISGMKIRVEAADAFYYPDVMVTCDPADTEPYYSKESVLAGRGAFTQH